MLLDFFSARVPEEDCDWMISEFLYDQIVCLRVLEGDEMLTEFTEAGQLVSCFIFCIYVNVCS